MKKNFLFTFVILLMTLCSSTKVWAEEEQRVAYATVINHKLLRFEYITPESQSSKLTATPGDMTLMMTVEIKDEYSSGNYPEWCSEPIEKVEFDSSFADYRPKSTAYWFHFCEELESFEGLENLNTSEVTNMYCMFYACKSLKNLDLSGFDTRNVVNMGSMFSACHSLTTINVSDFDTSNVKYMGAMFHYCESLTNIDVSCFNTSNVETMSSMFSQCNSLKSIDVSGFNTEKVKQMHHFFANCKNIQELNLGSFNTQNVTKMNYMFNDCQKLTKIIVSQDGWNTEKVTDHTMMFGGCTKLVGGKGTKFDSNHVNIAYAHIDGGTSNPGYLTEDTNGQFEDNSGQTRAYCVINNNVLTFYHDNKISSRQGLKFPVNRDDGRSGMPEWYYKRMYVNKAVIDPSFAAFQPTSTARWFYNFAAMTTIEGLSNLNTSQVTTMTEMFRFCDKLNNLDLSSFDTSNVTDMSFMVCYCTSLSNLNVSGFNTSKVVDMQHMFHMSPASELDLRSFDTKNVKLMNTMFCDTKLKTIYVSDKWSTESVENSLYMFWGSRNLVGGMGTKYTPEHIDHEYACIDGGLCAPGYLTGETQNGNPEAYAVLDEEGTLTFYYDWNKECREGEIFDVKEYEIWKIGWRSNRDDIIHVVFDPSFAEYRPTSTAEWFLDCDQLESITNIQYLNTGQVVDMNRMFAECHKLQTLDVSHFDTSNVENMFGMFSDCTKLTKLDVSRFNTSNVTNMGKLFRSCSAVTELDVSHFNTSNVTNMSGMFGGCSSITELDVSHFITSNVLSMEEMFWACSKIAKLDVSKFNTSKVWNMSKMFSNCFKLQNLDVRHFDTSNVEDMHEMFSNCRSLTELDVSHFNTYNVIHMGWMFFNCIKLIELDLTTFNTSNVKSMDYMFGGCNELTKLDVGNFNTSNVTDMSYMFNYCHSITELDLSCFKTDKVERFQGMFNDCENITTIYVSNYWSTAGLESISTMFERDEKLVGGQGTCYADHLYGYSSSLFAHIDGGPDNPGYFTYKEYVVPTSIEELPMDCGDNQGDVWYSLQGVRVSQPTRGLFIHNGKKVVVK